VQHKGAVYHVQTEDSGEENASIATHLFVGGTILDTLRSTYEKLLGGADLQAKVRAQMEAQHKEMLRNLVGGKYDGLGPVPSFQPGEIEFEPTSQVPPPPPTVRESHNPISLLDMQGQEPASEAPKTASGLPPQRAEGGFGAASITDRRLDQVILAYLSDHGDDE
jgi:hypothetical protein